MTWFAVNGDGRSLATGRRPQPGEKGEATPAAALTAAPAAAWPMGAVAEDGRYLSLGEALGPGGDRVEDILRALVESTPLDQGQVEALARATPAGTIDLPIATVSVDDAVAVSAGVDPAWLAAVDRQRADVRKAVVAAGRGEAVEAAVHVAMLVATERLDPADDADVDAHVASGAQLWLLTGAVVSALADRHPDPFAAWARLIAGGWWPVGPSGGRLVVARTARRGR